jgi:hypothetical protein
MRLLTCQPGRVESSYLGNNSLQGYTKVLIQTHSRTPSRMCRRDARLREVLIHIVASRTTVILRLWWRPSTQQQIPHAPHLPITSHGLVAAHMGAAACSAFHSVVAVVACVVENEPREHHTSRLCIPTFRRNRRFTRPLSPSTKIL